MQRCVSNYWMWIQFSNQSNCVLAFLWYILMRHSGAWMTIWDDRILEVIREEGSGTPKQLDESGYLHISKSQISRRCRKLGDKGFLQPLGNGVYTITEKGEAYLDEEYDAEREKYIKDGNCSPNELPNGTEAPEGP